MSKDPFDIMVKGKSTQDQIASYLVKVVLGLRDKENIQKSVKLLGSGAAIPHAILVAEIIRSRIKGVNSITQFESMAKDITNQNNQDQLFKLYIPAIRITLTMNPTEEEKLMPGFQIQNEVGEDKHIQLFDYVMMYIRNLYFWRGNAKDQKRDNRYNRDNRDNRDTRDHRDNRDNRDTRDHRDIRDNRDNRDNKRQNDDNKRYKEIKSNIDDNIDRRHDNYTKTYQQAKNSYGNPDKSDNWNKDRNQFQQTQHQGNLISRGNYRNNRNDRNIHPQKIDQYEQKNEDTTVQAREEKVIKYGAIRTRGGQQRDQN